MKDNILMNYNKKLMDIINKINKSIHEQPLIINNESEELYIILNHLFQEIENTFKLIKKAKKSSIANLQDIQNKINILRDYIYELSEFFGNITGNLYEIKEKVGSQISHLLLPEKLTLEWYMSIDCRKSSFYLKEDREKISNWFCNTYGQKGLSEPFCYNTYTGQHIITIAFDQNKKFEEQLGILEFLPFIKYNKNNIKVISILETTCSANGCYEIAIDNQDQANLTCNGFDIFDQPKSLLDTLLYVYKKYPYKVFGSD